MNLPDYYALKQCDLITIDNESMPYMKSLFSCLNRIKGDGYIENFEKTLHGIHAISSDVSYLSKEFQVINFFRFEGNEKSGANVIMYMIETSDGVKGTLVKSYDSVTNKNKSMSTNQEIE